MGGYNKKLTGVGEMSSARVLVVDLDGTLILTDSLHEAVLKLIRVKPIMLLLLPFWLLSGIAYFKSKVAINADLDITTLPYNVSLIAWLKKKKAGKQKIVLCTAANERIAQEIFKHLDIFDDFIASDENTNLKSKNKRKALQKLYGEKGYDYAGNSDADLEVWAGASSAIVVNANKKLLTKVSQIATVSRTFPIDKTNISDWIRAVRLHQWLKNLLLFIPLLMAQQFGHFQTLSSLIIAFLSFSLCASSVYIANDLIDLENDRKHPGKKTRPFASAKIPLALGAMAVPILIGGSIVLGAIVGVPFLVVLMLYLLLTVAYTLVLKRLVLVDCITLAALYTIRIVAGANAVSVSLSFWLLAFSVFLFLSLAFVKRYTELTVTAREGESVAHGRGYIGTDASLLQTFGIASGYVSALVIGLYINSESVSALYARPVAIWLIIPTVLFWISWVWLKAARGEMHDDPVVFAFNDTASRLVAGLSIAIFVYATADLAF